jgi:hypothetical protein
MLGLVAGVGRGNVGFVEAEGTKSTERRGDGARGGAGRGDWLTVGDAMFSLRRASRLELSRARLVVRHVALFRATPAALRGD